MADYRLGLHLYNQNPKAINTIRRSYAGSHRRSRRWPDSTEALILLRKERPELPHGQAPQPTILGGLDPNYRAILDPLLELSPAPRPAKRPCSATRAATASTAWSLASSPPSSG